MTHNDDNKRQLTDKKDYRVNCCSSSKEERLILERVRHWEFSYVYLIHFAFLLPVLQLREFRSFLFSVWTYSFIYEDN